MKNYYIFIVGCLLPLITILSHNKVVNAQSSADSIDATIRISVCGDNVAENPEDCDNADLNDASCSTFNYTLGILSCNPDCSYDKSVCSGYVDPNPPGNQNQNQNSNNDDNDDDSNSSSSSNDDDDSTSSISATISEIINKVKKVIRNIPEKVAKFDTNNDDKLEKGETKKVVGDWVKIWQKNIKFLNPSLAQASPAERQRFLEECDLSGNSRCGLEDFSILLYYINR